MFKLSVITGFNNKLFFEKIDKNHYENFHLFILNLTYLTNSNGKINFMLNINFDRMITITIVELVLLLVLVLVFGNI